MSKFELKHCTIIVYRHANYIIACLVVINIIKSYLYGDLAAGSRLIFMGW